MSAFDTNPGDRSVSELEREVGEERARVSRTIDALQDRASLGNIVDQVAKAVGENGGEISRNLGRTLRDNPLPVILTGVGLAWLMASSGQPSRDRHAYDPYDDDPYDDLDDDLDDAPRFRASAVDPSTSAEIHRFAAEPGYEIGADEGAADSGPGLRERAAASGSGLRERAGGAFASARDAASGMTDAASDRLSDAGGAIAGAGDAARRQMRRGSRAVKHAGRDARRSLGRAGHGAQEGFDNLLEDQPLVLGALALALGAAVGGALPSSRTEDRMFGSQSDRLKQQGLDLAEAQTEKAVATAEAVADEAANIADETMADLDEALPEGGTLVERAGQRVGEAAERLRKAGSEEAERQSLGRNDPPSA